MVNQSLYAALFFFISVISGIWMLKKGEPYNKMVFNLHKISIVASTVFMVFILKQHFNHLTFKGIGLALFVSGCVFFLVAFISGSFLSFEKTARRLLKTAHKISSVLLVLIIVAVWLYCH